MGADKPANLADMTPEEKAKLLQPLQPSNRTSHTEKKVVVIAPLKSMGVAILLAILFGPLGMLYATIRGGVIMIVITLILVSLFPLLFLLTWPICVIWAAVSTSDYNRQLLERGEP